MPPPKGRLPPPPSSLAGQTLKVAAMSAAMGSQVLETKRSIIPPPPSKGGGSVQSTTAGQGKGPIPTVVGAPSIPSAPAAEAAAAAAMASAKEEDGYLDVSPAADITETMTPVDEPREAEYEAPSIASKRAEFTVKVEAIEGTEGYSITLGDSGGSVVIVELENVKAPYLPEVVRSSILLVYTCGEPTMAHSIQARMYSTRLQH